MKVLRQGSYTLMRSSSRGRKGNIRMEEMIEGNQASVLEQLLSRPAPRVMNELVTMVKSGQKY